ncbi:HPP family protein [Thiogranum longum]
MRFSLAALRGFTGFTFRRSGHLEKWISGCGGLVGILGVMTVSQQSLGLNGSASLVASMGASAVLLFAVPHGPLSQPWPVFGGHLVSALIGVACAKLIAPALLAAAAAVALAISSMYYLRCIHPPGGATALTAVAGGEAVHALGFTYVLTPVLLNVLIILAVAFLFNLPFSWRRYPSVWASSSQSPVPPGGDCDGSLLPQEKGTNTQSIDTRCRPGESDADTLGKPGLRGVDQSA